MPEALRAIVSANEGYSAAYGEEAAMARVANRIREIFEAPNAAVYLVATGTAANALLLAGLCSPWGTVYCHADAHIQRNECGAPEFYTGGAKLTPLTGADGKIDPAALRDVLAVAGRRDIHSVQPGVLSLTNATECGTVYTPEEIRALSGIARAMGLPVHLDGARFANALVSVGCTAAQLTWKAGVDAMSLGGTKNGLIGVETVILFDPVRAREFELRRKRGGHLIARHRYMSAQVEAYLTDGLWLELAGRANRSAALLSRLLQKIPLVTIRYPTEANAVFGDWPRIGHLGLQSAGVRYAFWPQDCSIDGDDSEMLQARLVCNWATEPTDVQQLAEILDGVLSNSA